MLVDTHCHLDLSVYNEDRDDVLENARNSGVNRMLIPGINLGSIEQVNAIAGYYPEIYSAVGIHPNDADCWNSDTYRTLLGFAGYPKVVAIGEIGLDYYWDRVPDDLQRTVFEQQLELSAETNLPVIIHTRDRDRDRRSAIQDAYSVLKDWVNKINLATPGLSYHPGVLHSFSYDCSWAMKFVELNFMIGITGPITFKKADQLKEVVKTVDLSNLLVETDSPFLTPSPYRGRRNQPANVRFIVAKISEIKNIPFEEVASVTTENARRVFSW